MSAELDALKQATGDLALTVDKLVTSPTPIHDNPADLVPITQQLTDMNTKLSALITPAP